MKAVLSLKLIAAILILGAISASFSDETQKSIMKKFMNSPTEEIFEVYHAIFKKSYEINSEEGLQRMQNFAANVRFINEHQSSSPALEVDLTTDLPHEMWKRLLTMNGVELETTPSSFSDNISVGSVRVNGMCLAPASTTEGAAVTLQRCTWYDIQNWRLQASSLSGMNEVIHAQSGLYLARGSGSALLLSSSNSNSLKLGGKYGMMAHLNESLEEMTFLWLKDAKTNALDFYASYIPSGNMIFQFDYTYGRMSAIGNLKIGGAQGGKCVTPTTSGLTVQECDGSDSQGFKFVRETNPALGFTFVITHTSGKVVTVDKSSGRVSLANKSSGLVQNFVMEGQFRDFFGSNLVAIDSTFSYVKFLNPANISQVSSTTDTTFNSNIGFYFTYCYPGDLSANRFAC